MTVDQNEVTERIQLEARKSTLVQLERVYKNVQVCEQFATLAGANLVGTLTNAGKSLENGKIALDDLDKTHSNLPVVTAKIEEISRSATASREKGLAAQARLEEALKLATEAGVYSAEATNLLVELINSLNPCAKPLAASPQMSAAPLAPSVMAASLERLDNAFTPLPALGPEVQPSTALHLSEGILASSTSSIPGATVTQMSAEVTKAPEAGKAKNQKQKEAHF